MELQIQMIETLRELTLQVMLISAGVFGIVGGFVSSTEKVFSCTERALLVISLSLFAGSALAGYVVHGAIISQLNKGHFDPFHHVVEGGGIAQIAMFVIAGIFLIIFLALITGRKR